MSIIQETTGHSARGERNIARILYISIGIAVFAGIVIFFAVGQKSSLSPFKSDDPTKTPPSESQPAAPVAPAQ